MPTIDQLRWSSLTAAVNEIKSPNQFLQRLMFGRERTLPTETVELSSYVRGRKFAPFVAKDGEAVMVSGHSTTFATVEAPNIRIKHPLTPADFLYQRRPASPVFPTGGTIRQAINEHIALDLQAMVDQVTESKEWMVAKLIASGQIVYQDEETGANFQITFPRNLTDTVNKTLWTTPPGGAFWNAATAANRKILGDVQAAKRIINYWHSLNPTIAVAGSEAADVIINQLNDNPTFVSAALDTRDVRVGNLNLTSFFDEDGVIPIGRLGGLPIVEYSRTVVNPSTGSTESLINPKYIHFICTAPAAEHTMYYGAIADNRTFRGNFQTRMFSKSWEIEDPSAIMALVHSRPLPALRRPNTIVSMKVVSG